MRRKKSNYPILPILAIVLYLLLTTIIALTTSRAGHLFPEPIVDWVSTKMILSEDIDGDGHLDLTVANGNPTGKVFVYLGRGDGTYDPRAVTDVGANPWSLAAGELNGDSNTDLVVPLNGADQIQVLLGNGDGTFAVQTAFASGSNPRWAALGYFDMDANLDLAVANQGSGDLSIYMGNGNGTFGTESRIAVGTGPWMVVTGLFNADAVIDLGVANHGSDDVAILLGNGNGTFGTPTSVAAGDGPSALAVGNVDADSDLDLVVALDLEDRVAVLENDGTGSFSVGARPSAGNAPGPLALGDLDGDTHLDISVANTGGNIVSVLLGVGDGTFPSESQLHVWKEPHTLALDDLDEDGELDLAVSSAYYSDSNPRLLLYFGNGDGTFGKNDEYTTSGLWSIAAGDLDGDGHQDLATAGGASPSSDIGVLFGNGDGSFGPAAYGASLPDPVFQIVLGDFSGDNLLDLAVAKQGSSGGVWLAPNLGGGSFGTPTFHPAGNAGNYPGQAIGDFNADGRLDLAVPSGQTDELAMLIGNGDGTFQPEVRYGAGDLPQSAAVADFNEDGRQDVVVSDFGYRGPEALRHFSVFLGRGDGTFEPEIWFPTTPSHANGVAVADLNSDGHEDVVIGSENWWDFAIHFGHGDGSFGAAIPIESRVGAIYPAVGDFDMSGTLDLAIANVWFERHSSVAFFSGDGMGSFADPVFFEAGLSPWPLAVADFDENGTPDLGVGHYQGTDDTSVLLNQHVPSGCLDTDGDGFGYPGNPVCAGGLPEDCDDSRGSVYPGAVELCDGLDNDCDQKIDEGYDTDGDFSTSCNGDCNDANPLMSGFAIEVCNDSLDNDCDGFVDGGIPAPSGTPSLTVLERSMSWTVPSSARVYDVVKGDAQTLHDNAGDFSAAVLGCALDAYQHTSSDALDIPAVGQIFWYLARGGNCSGSGTYDSGGPSQAGARDTGVAGSPSACP